MLNAICITTNQLEHIQTHLCIHLSYLEYQKNLKIYNKNIKKKKRRGMLDLWKVEKGAGGRGNGEDRVGHLV